MGRYEATSTQERNPRSAVFRTVLAVAVAAFPLLNGVLMAVIEALKPFEAFVPGWVFLGLNGVLLAVTVLAAVVTRALAVPGVNEWLRKYRVLRWFTPEDAGSAEGVIPLGGQGPIVGAVDGAVLLESSERDAAAAAHRPTPQP